MSLPFEEANTPSRVLRRLRLWTRRRAAVSAAVGAASKGKSTEFPQSLDVKALDASRSLGPAESAEGGDAPSASGPAHRHELSAFMRPGRAAPPDPSDRSGTADVLTAAASPVCIQAENTIAGTVTAELLVMANERLIVESLRAQVEAESALDALQEVTRRAEHDPLTQLPNRVLLLDRFSRAIASAERHGGRLALLFLDLDGFKQINDTLGHATGDEVLKLVARRLSSSVRKADTVSRHGGDEFLILLTEVSQASDARLIADKVRAALKAPARVGQQVFSLSASIGISLYPDNGLDADQLIQQADAAMYEAKRRNDGGVQAARRVADHATPPARRVPTGLDLRLAESERRNERLVEENRRLAAALEQAQERLTAAEQTRRREIEFMVVLAHDLCMPLASDHATAAELERIGAEQPLLGPVQDSLNKHRVDINALINEAIKACGPAMAARQQHLSVRLPARRPVVLGDPVRLAQALCNLLENASKYTQLGGRISVGATAGKDRVELTVSDNGRGIDPRLLPGIFEPFVRGSNDSGPDGAGLGLGLTLVRQFIEAHGGQVAANSGGEGKGSDFVITLPLADPTAGAPPFHHA